MDGIQRYLSHNHSQSHWEHIGQKAWMLHTTHMAQRTAAAYCLSNGENQWIYFFVMYYDFLHWLDKLLQAHEARNVNERVCVSVYCECSACCKLQVFQMQVFSMFPLRMPFPITWTCPSKWETTYVVNILFHCGLCVCACGLTFSDALLWLFMA